MKTTCIFCRGTLSHRNNATKDRMCPEAYSRKRARQRAMYARLSWIQVAGTRLRGARNKRRERLNTSAERLGV